MGSRVTHLNLGCSKIGIAGVEALAAILKGTEITHLDLEVNGIRSDGTIALANALVGSRVTHLNLGDNKIELEGAIALAGGLVGSRVTHLNLRDNEIAFEGEGVKALAGALVDSRVEHLNLECNGMGFEGTVALADSLVGSRVTHLNLRDNEIAFEGEGVKALAAILKGTEITHLDLSYNHYISNDEVIILANALVGSKVEYLNLAVNGIEDQEAVVLAGALAGSRIAYLDLSGNKIGDKGAVALADSGVTYLDLRDNSVTSAAVVEKIVNAKIHAKEAATEIYRNFDIDEIVPEEIRELFLGEAGIVAAGDSSFRRGTEVPESFYSRILGKICTITVETKNKIVISLANKAKIALQEYSDFADAHPIIAENALRILNAIVKIGGGFFAGGGAAGGLLFLKEEAVGMAVSGVLGNKIKAGIDVSRKEIAAGLKASTPGLDNGGADALAVASLVTAALALEGTAHTKYILEYVRLPKTSNILKRTDAIILHRRAPKPSGKEKYSGVVGVFDPSKNYSKKSFHSKWQNFYQDPKDRRIWHSRDLAEHGECQARNQEGSAWKRFKKDGDDLVLIADIDKDGNVILNKHSSNKIKMRLNKKEFNPPPF